MGVRLDLCATSFVWSRKCLPLDCLGAVDVWALKENEGPNLILRGRLAREIRVEADLSAFHVSSPHVA